MNPPSPTINPAFLHATIAQPIGWAKLCDLGAAFESIIIRRCSTQMQALFSPLATNNMPQFVGRLPPAIPDKWNGPLSLGPGVVVPGCRVPGPGSWLQIGDQQPERLTFNRQINISTKAT